MIDPVIFEFNLLGLPITLRWYGVLVMFGAVVGALIAEREIKRRGENGESVWDALVWILPAGILGARLWYVVNNILGGSDYYTSDPGRIFKVWEGGLHFFGGLLFGGIALYYYLKQEGMDFWLFLDAIAPAALIGQALARPANFINQELYGQPTTLPWGIQIDSVGNHRLPLYSDLTQFPVETTRFHPTFAYEMILNILMGLLLLWIARRYAETIKPGAIFSGWLISAGLIRTFIEFFRPDQPRIGESFVTYSMLVSILMAIAGVVTLLIRTGKLQVGFAEDWEEQYQIKSEPVASVARQSPAQRVKPLVRDAARAEYKKPTVVDEVPAIAEVKHTAVAHEIKQAVIEEVVVVAEPKVKEVEAAKEQVEATASAPNTAAIAIKETVEGTSPAVQAKKKPTAKAKATKVTTKKPAVKAKAPAKKAPAKKAPAKKSAVKPKVSEKKAPAKKKPAVKNKPAEK